MQSLFNGLTVVEFAGVLAGPAVGNFFSELGAKVIKVENKHGGDVTRTWRQPDETPEGPSAYYASVNWNKHSVFLDFNNTEDHKKALDLVKEADVIITNFKKGDAEKFGLSFREIKIINSSVIYGHISGFGSQSDRLAYDLILQAETGFMSMNGQPESPPTKMPLALIDVLAAHQLKEGILCAMLKQKEQPGQAYLVEVSLYDSAVASLINQATNWLMNRNLPQRTGSLHPNIAPYGEVFTTKDGRSITLAIGNNRHFQRLCKVLKLDHLLEEDRFQVNSQRVENRGKLYEILSKTMVKWQADALLEVLQEQQVPAGEIKNLKQVFETEAARSLLLEEEQEGRRTTRPRTTVFHMRSLDFPKN
jgi:crotonobetainyl-CoA:carnitine CoA-transferase CaiB-like acyl-CoA transferase